MAIPNFWDNGITSPYLNPDLIPWGAYNLSVGTPDLLGWLDNYGPQGKQHKYAMVLQPGLQTPAPTTTALFDFQISSNDEPCWGTLWFAFVPYRVSTGQVQGSQNRAHSRIYVLALDAGGHSGWYYTDDASKPLQWVDALHVGADIASVLPSSEPTPLWVYFDYANETAYAGLGSTLATGSIDRGRGVKLSPMLSSHDADWGYAMAFAKLDASDPKSSTGGIGPVRLFTDGMACCLNNGPTGLPPGSMDCHGLKPGNSSCDGIVGTSLGADPSGYCGTNPTDPLCACQNGNLGSTALNYCFGIGCVSPAYRSDSVQPNCSSECVNVLNVKATGNISWGSYNSYCQVNPILAWLSSNWLVSLVVLGALLAIVAVVWLFEAGWL